MKKYVFLIFVSVVTLFSFNSESASAAYYCNGASDCRQASMTYGENVAAFSLKLYLNAGETVKYDWENNPPGIMQVGFGVYKDGRRVSKELLAVGRVGENFGFYTAPTSGYYYLGAYCEGGNDRRCQGGGTIRKW